MKSVRLIPLLWPVLALLILSRPSAAQDVTVQASVDETTVGEQDRVFYTIEIQGASYSEIEPPEPPATQGLVLMQSTPSTQRNLSIVNGQMNQNIVYRWMYRPVRQGTARLYPAEVTVRGRTYRTAPIEINVVDQTRRLQRGSGVPGDSPGEEERPEIDERDLFIRGEPSARTAYQNEQVTIEYRLYFRQGMQLGQSRLADSWDAEGFWREDLNVDLRPVPHAVVEDGIRYRTIVLKRIAVFPTRAGTLEVDPLRIESEVYLPFGSGAPFARFFPGRSRFEPVEVESPPVTIEVKPLPEGAPEDFGGAVGTFRMNTRVDRTEVEVGESVEVEVEISGTGNLATLEAPTLEAPGVFEAYDPRVETSITRSGEAIRGTKTFTYVLVPRSNGTFTLPAPTFSFLDPETGRYRTLEGPSPTLRVTGTPAASPPTAAAASGLPADDIAGPLRLADWQPAAGTPLHLRLWPYLALLLPLLALGGLYAYHRHATRLATDLGYARGRRAHPAARRRLQQAQHLLTEGRPRLFYEELERAVLGFIGDRLNIAEQGLTRSQLRRHLAAAGAPPEQIAELDQLLNACDRGRFSPDLPDRPQLEADYDRAARLIADLDRMFNRTPLARAR